MGLLQNWFIARLVPHDVPRKICRDECPGRNHLPIVVRHRLHLNVDADILIIRGREWRPGQIAVRGSPGDPGWTPTAARHPEPPHLDSETPSAVVVGGPAERRIRGPHPSVTIRVDPAAVGVRSPLLIYVGRNPYVLALQPHPITVGLEPVVKNCPVHPTF